MADRLAPLRKGFRQRAQLSRAWAGLAYAQPRNRLMWVLVLAPAFALTLLVALDPDGLGLSVTDPDNVHAVFARFISAIATAATVAVSVASLVLGREMKGIEGQDEHHRANMAFRNHLREAAGRRVAPMAFGPFLAMALGVVARRAQEVRRAASPDDLAAEREGAPLDGFLDLVEEQARHAARRMETTRHPHRLLTLALDVEQEVTHHLARAFARDERLPAHVRDALAELAGSIKDLAVATRYLKTLDTQWGLSRMSSTILVTTLPSVVGATAMVLVYDDRLVAAVGVVPAGAIVGAALGIVLLPLAAIVSHLLRFVFVNQRTLPAEDFVLGPERPDVVEDQVPSGREEGAPRRARAT